MSFCIQSASQVGLLPGANLFLPLHPILAVGSVLKMFLKLQRQQANSVINSGCLFSTYSFSPFCFFPASTNFQCICRNKIEKALMQTFLFLLSYSLRAVYREPDDHFLLKKSLYPSASITVVLPLTSGQISLFLL